jgi:hypothetical protein
MRPKSSQDNEDKEQQKQEVAAVVEGLHHGHARIAEFSARTKFPRDSDIEQLHDNHQGSQSPVFAFLERIFVLHPQEVSILRTSGQRVAANTVYSKTAGGEKKVARPKDKTPARCRAGAW